MPLGRSDSKAMWRREGTGIGALSRSALIRIGVVALLLGLTIGWFNLFPRYQQDGDELQRNGRFEQGLEGWTVSGPADAISVNAGTATIEIREPDRAARLSQVLPLKPEHRVLGLRVDVATEGVKAGAKPWQTARVYLIGRNSEGKALWNPHFEAVVLSGDTPWNRYSGVLILPKDASDAVINAAMIRATGILRIRNVSVFPIREQMPFRTGVFVLFVGWAIVAAVVLPPVVRGLRSTTARVAICLVALAILVGVLIPYPLKREILRSLASGLRGGQSLLPAHPPWIDRLLEGAFAHLDALAHGLLFFAVALFVRVFRSDDHAFVQFGLLLLFAGVTETLQYFTLSRTPGLSDWLWDAGGISLAFGVSWCLGVGRKPRRA